MSLYQSDVVTGSPDARERIVSMEGLDLVDICARQCGAKCCRRPSIYVAESERWLFEEELLAEVEMMTADGPVTAVAGTGGFYRPEGPCKHLDQNTNLCTVYEVRPKACREFPTGPIPGCILSDMLAPRGGIEPP